MKTNIAIVFGGVSCEHDISIISAMQVIYNLDKNVYNVVPIYITKEGDWMWGKELADISFFSSDNCKKLKKVCFVAGSNYLYKKSTLGYTKFLPIDVCLPVMHGLNGEDGSIYALMKMCDIPVAGSGLTGSSLGLDKCCFKTFAKGLKIKTVLGCSLNKIDYLNNPEKFAKEFLKDYKLPIILKPNNLGSSIGIKIIKKASEFNEALNYCFSFDATLLAEQYLEKIREINIAVLNDNNNLILSDLEEPITQNNILSFNDKYLSKESSQNFKRVIPAKVSGKAKKIIEDCALTLCKEMQLKGVVRFDFILSEDEVYLNEVNTIPGSLAYYLFKNKGITFTKLLNIIIGSAIKEHSFLKHQTNTFETSVLAKGELAGKAIK